MPKPSSVFVCQVCSYISPKWLGQCPNCSSWNTFEETISVPAGRDASAGRSGSVGIASEPVRFSSLSTSPKSAFNRISTGVEEFDRVMGGGVVLGSVTMLGGEPGIGKSTLLTQIVINILKRKEKDTRIIYVCGEESPQQISLRIRRMLAGSVVKPLWGDRLLFVPDTNLENAIASIEQEKPALVVVDSIQSMSTDDLTGAAGSIGQLKECTVRLTRVAKRLHVPMFLVGHVTKEGEIAGPKVLEHIVDAVLELSGERSGFYRILRTTKNRFGATDEVGVFQVVENGLEEVPNPSKLFLEGSHTGVPGSAIVPLMEGTRAMMIEVQALVVPSQLPVPRRVARGISVPRIQLLAAVLQKHCRLSLGTMDIFVNAAGGFEIREPAADLAIAMAIASSFASAPLPSETVYAGEIGLLGEIRSVGLLEKREKEARRLGYLNMVSRKQSRTIRQLVSNLERSIKGNRKLIA